MKERYEISEAIEQLTAIVEEAHAVLIEKTINFL